MSDAVATRKFIKTKKALKELIGQPAADHLALTWIRDDLNPPGDGLFYCKGPDSLGKEFGRTTAPNRWYAQVTIKAGVIVKVT